MKFSVLILSILAATSARAESGRTADGCTYRILNGQYLTDCSAKKKKEPASEAAAAPVPNEPVYSEPVSSYGDVPMRQNPFAPVPSVQPQPAPVVKAPDIVKVPLAPAPGPSALSAYETTLRDFEENRKQRRIDRIVERPYVSATIGSTTITNTDSGSATGFGLNVGTLLDEYFGVELGYTYAKQGLNLGLPNRFGGTIAAYGQDDASLKSHLINIELQGYVTNALRRFRPFLGLGLGLKSSTLTELADERSGPTYTGNDGTLTQTSFGGSASAGAKLRVSKDLSLGVAFRYFFPFARQTPRLEQPAPVYGIPGDNPPTTTLTKADDSLTGSSQYQFSGGLQYAF
jgi:opacity protein-like surface antigen